jgi:hypothetical protein
LVFSKTWVKNQSNIQAGNTISGATNSHRDIKKGNQPLLFFHLVPINSFVWTRKSFIGSLVSCGVDFLAKLGSKISHGFKLSAQFLGPPTATGTSQTGTNHFYSFTWFQQTALYGQGKVLLGIWCVSCGVGF